MNDAYRWLRIPLFCLSVLSTCVACTTWPNDAPPNSVARISGVVGPQATLNGRPARVGDYLLPDDRVATGNHSYLEVAFRQGGIMQLDQNTDPWLEVQWEQVKTGSCQIVRVVFGHIFFNADNLCIKDPNLSGIMRSQVVLTSNSARSELVVHYGNFELTSPNRMFVKAGEGLVVARGTMAQVRTLRANELDDSMRWRAVFYGGDARAIVPDRTSGNAAPAAATPADPGNVGYCCVGREAFGASRGVCEQRKGRFFTKREDAQLACRL